MKNQPLNATAALSCLIALHGDIKNLLGDPRRRDLEASIRLLRNEIMDDDAGERWGSHPRQTTHQVAASQEYAERMIGEGGTLEMDVFGAYRITGPNEVNGGGIPALHTWQGDDAQRELESTLFPTAQPIRAEFLTYLDGTDGYVTYQGINATPAQALAECLKVELDSGNRDPEDWPEEIQVGREVNNILLCHAEQLSREWTGEQANRERWQHHTLRILHRALERANTATGTAIGGEGTPCITVHKFTQDEYQPILNALIGGASIEEAAQALPAWNTTTIFEEIRVSDQPLTPDPAEGDDAPNPSSQVEEYVNRLCAIDLAMQGAVQHIPNYLLSDPLVVRALQLQDDKYRPNNLALDILKAIENDLNTPEGHDMEPCEPDSLQGKVRKVILDARRAKRAMPTPDPDQPGEYFYLADCEWEGTGQPTRLDCLRAAWQDYAENPEGIKTGVFTAESLQSALLRHARTLLPVPEDTQDAVIDHLRKHLELANETAHAIRSGWEGLPLVNHVWHNVEEVNSARPTVPQPDEPAGLPAPDRQVTLQLMFDRGATENYPLSVPVDATGKELRWHLTLALHELTRICIAKGLKMTLAQMSDTLDEINFSQTAALENALKWPRARTVILGASLASVHYSEMIPPQAPRPADLQIQAQASGTGT